MKSILQIYDINTKQISVVKSFDKHIEAPNWTPDGKSLVFNSNGNIFVYDLELGDERKLDTGTLFCNNDHVLSSDGAMLAVSAETEQSGSSKIYILPFAGGEMKLVTKENPSYLHGWSPDGKTLAYCACRNGDYDVYTITTEQGEEKRLTIAEGLDDGPEYTPDGKYIWFNSVRSGLMQLWRMNADGTEQTQMTDDNRNNWFAHISPDNEKIVFISYNSKEVAAGDHPANKNVKIRMMPAQGGEICDLFDLFGGQGTINVNSWNPQSTKFAFVRHCFLRKIVTCKHKGV